MSIQCEDTMTDQQYSFDGRPGCVMRHKSRVTKTTIGVYKADQAGLDDAEGDWIAVCEDHGTRYPFSTLSYARAHYATAPWCEGCHPDGVPGVPPPPPLKPRGPKSSEYIGIYADEYLSLNQRLYDELGAPDYLRLRWFAGPGHLVITPAKPEDATAANVYRVRGRRHVSGRDWLDRAVHATVPIRAAGLTNGKYRPHVEGNRIAIKAEFKVEQAATDDQADDQADDDQAQH